MKLEKTAAKNLSEHINIKTAGMQNARNAAPIATKSAPQNVPQSAPQPQSLLSAANFSLPSDKLSASIISFARFFSLPIKPELMAEIRRQVFIPPDPNIALQYRETLSLAAAAAEAKGTELSQKGLEYYAEAIDPECQKKQNPGDRNQRERRNKNHFEPENISATGIKETLLETAENDALLAVLNRLPGKNKKRWIILPFQFSKGGIDYKASLRILADENHLANENFPEKSQCSMVLDLIESGKSSRRWIFVLESGKGEPDKLAVYLSPMLLSGQKTFVKKLSGIMNIPENCISLMNFAGSFPFEMNCKNDLLRSINLSV